MSSAGDREIADPRMLLPGRRIPRSVEGTIGLWKCPRKKDRDSSLTKSRSRQLASFCSFCGIEQANFTDVLLFGRFSLGRKIDVFILPQPASDDDQTVHRPEYR